MEIEFVPLETWNKLEYEGNTYYEGIDIKLINKVGFDPGEDELSVRKLWVIASSFTGYAEGAYPPIETVIRDKATGVLLRDLPVV